MHVSPAQEPDWFVVSLDIAERIGNAPKLRWKRNHFEAHRSLLPLVRDHNEVAPLLDRKIDEDRTVARDELTQELGFVLRQHQHAGIEFGLNRRASLIADSMRLGKTIQTVMTHNESDGSFVVICPKIAREVWKYWILKRYPSLSDGDLGILEGKTPDPAEFKKPFVIGHYDILKYWQGKSGNIGTLVFDEAHVLSKRDNHRVISANFMASRAKKVLALTGTPLWNRPIGLWSILSLLAPEAWGSFYEFADRYCDPEVTAHGTKYNGSSNERELMARLSEVMIRRKLADTIGLPPITRNVSIAELTREQRFEIDILAEEIRKIDSIQTAIGTMARYRRVLGEFKREHTIKVAQARLEKGEPVVIWVWHKDTGKLLKKALTGLGHKAWTIAGDTSDNKRIEALNGWRAHPNGALVMSIAVGTTAIDLSHAQHAVFCEIDFTPAIIAQAEMRIFKMDRAMFVDYIVADHPADRQMIAALQEKLDLGARIDVPAADAAIDVLKTAFDIPLPDGDVNRLLAAMLEIEY
jgi:SWI/SNF-related matrix-associated actin-dependent regulator 1 of chromatin subfamily A